MKDARSHLEGSGGGRKKEEACMETGCLWPTSTVAEQSRMARAYQ